MLIRTYAFFLIVLCIFSGVAFAQNTVKNTVPVYTVAVLDLEAVGVSQVEARGLSDKLRSHISQLIHSGSLKDISYRLIERTQMDKIFEQFEIQNMGCVSDSCAVEFGKMLQADRIIIGSVSIIGETYSVTARIVDVETGTAISSADRQHRGLIDDVLVNVMPQVGNALLFGDTVNTVVTSINGNGGAGAGKPSIEPVLADIFENSFHMVAVAGGAFEMGSDNGLRDEKPVHTVTLEGFEISTTEITQEQYKRVTGSDNSEYKGGKGLPAECVSWFDAARFCNSLSRMAGLDPCYFEGTWLCDLRKNGFRLPTEAEWEYACRAGGNTEFPDGDTAECLDKAGWYKGNSDGVTHPVGEKEPNAWGLYDMNGNVWEWVNDWYGKYPREGVRNPVGPQSGKYCLYRGGCYDGTENDCRAAKRRFNIAKTRHETIGFRVVRSDWRAD